MRVGGGSALAEPSHRRCTARETHLTSARRSSPRHEEVTEHGEHRLEQMRRGPHTEDIPADGPECRAKFDSSLWLGRAVANENLQADSPPSGHNPFPH
jgi:hypothetical protein